MPASRTASIVIVLQNGVVELRDLAVNDNEERLAPCVIEQRCAAGAGQGARERISDGAYRDGERYEGNNSELPALLSR
jgi:hypothetical protein